MKLDNVDLTNLRVREVDLNTPIQQESKMAKVLKALKALPVRLGLKDPMVLKVTPEQQILWGPVDPQVLKEIEELRDPTARTDHGDRP